MKPMNLSLGTTDRARLASAIRALTSPLAAASFEHWLAEVNRSLKELIGADKAAFMFPPEGGIVRASSDEFASPALESYMRDHLPQIERRWNTRTRTVKLQVFNRRLLYGEHLREMYRSSYYNELVLPTRAFDAIGMALALESPSKVVNLLLHHDRPTGRRFGSRALDLLRLVYPAFCSGVHVARTLFPMRQRLTALADAIPVAMAFADANGRILHLNRELRRHREADPDSALIDGGLARAVRRRAPSAVTTRTARYDIRICTFGADGDSAAVPAFVVIVTRAGAPAFPAQALARAYHLTRREVEVIRLLGEGATNDSIARRLSIRPATARHHTESVMRKMDVHSRAQIPMIIAAVK